MALFDNKIKKIGDELVENKKLQYLDLSNNLIEECDLDKLPQSITIFNIENNPLKLEECYVKSCLTNLFQFNKREYIDEEFVPEEKLPFDRSTLSQMRSSQSGLDLLKSVPKKDVKEVEEGIPSTSTSLAEISKANSEIVENYKQALMEEMERIKKEFKEKKEKLIAEIQERKSKLRDETNVSHSSDSSSESIEE